MFFQNDQRIMGVILRYVGVPTDPPPPPGSPAADRPTRQPPTFGSTKGGGSYTAPKTVAHPLGSHIGWQQPPWLVHRGFRHCCRQGHLRHPQYALLRCCEDVCLGRLVGYPFGADPWLFAWSWLQASSVPVPPCFAAVRPICMLCRCAFQGASAIQRTWMMLPWPCVRLGRSWACPLRE